MKKLLLALSAFILIFLNLRMFGRSPISGEFRMNVPFFNVIKRDPERERIVGQKLKLENALARFRRRPGFGQIGLQEVLNLIDVELAIVDGLLDGVGGYRLERIVNERNEIVSFALPAVLQVYDYILSLSSTSAQLEQKIRDSIEREKNRLSNALSYDDKEAFLLSMADALEYYYTVIEDIQFALSKVA